MKKTKLGKSEDPGARTILAELITSNRPMYRGSLIQYSRRCGNAKCRCAQGELHTGWALSYSVGGKTRVVYISGDLRESIAEGLADQKRLQELVERVISEDIESLRKRARRYVRRT
jgi:hypothetical protein